MSGDICDLRLARPAMEARKRQRALPHAHAKAHAHAHADAHAHKRGDERGRRKRPLANRENLCHNHRACVLVITMLLREPRGCSAHSTHARTRPHTLHTPHIARTSRAPARRYAAPWCLVQAVVDTHSTYAKMCASWGVDAHAGAARSGEESAKLQVFEDKFEQACSCCGGRARHASPDAWLRRCA